MAVLRLEQISVIPGPEPEKETKLGSHAEQSTGTGVRVPLCSLVDLEDHLECEGEFLTAAMRGKVQSVTLDKTLEYMMCFLVESFGISEEVVAREGTACM